MAAWNVEKAFEVKRTLVLVCKDWQALAIEFLYEDIRIRHGARGLVEALSRSARVMGSAGYGYWVRRIELPPTRRRIVNDDPTNPIRLIDILKFCPRVEILVKQPSLDDDDDVQFWEGIASTGAMQTDRITQSLTSLKRLDWVVFDPSVTFRLNPAITQTLDTRLSGIIFRSPNLEYFSLSSSSDAFQDFDRDTYPTPFPSLTTLRLERLTPWSVKLRTQDMPKLTNVIANPVNMYCRLSTACPFMDAFGRHIRVIELADNEGPYTFSSETAQEFFRRCSNLQELSLHAGRHTFLLIKLHHPSVKCIRILRRYHQSHDLLERQHTAIFSGVFPALERVVLHGEWGSSVDSVQFREFRHALLNKGCALEYEEGILPKRSEAFSFPQWYVVNLIP